MTPSAEIAALRLVERAIEHASSEADRLCRDLVGRYACDFVCMPGVPHGAHVQLPLDWASGPATLTATVVSGAPSKMLRGPVGVSMETLRWLVETVGHCPACGALLASGKCIRCEEDGH